jgi:hypothetical protein
MAKQIVSFGRITVPTAGTPVRITATATPIAELWATSYGTGTAIRMYVGLAGMTVATGANVLGEVFPFAATTGAPDRWDVVSSDEGNPYDASNFWVDAATNGGSLYIWAVQN